MLTTLVAADDAFGSRVVIPTEKKGSPDRIAVVALRAFVRSVAQPRMVLQCDCEPAIVDVVKRVCDTTPGVQMCATPVASKGFNGRVEHGSHLAAGRQPSLRLRAPDGPPRGRLGFAPLRLVA